MAEMKGESRNKNERLYNAIENTLAHMHKRVSPKGQMEVLRNRYPSPTFMLESNTYMLTRVGLTRLDAFYYTAIPGLARRSAKDAFGTKPKLNKVSLMAEYLKSYFIGIHIECFYLICLDRSGRLIDSILLQKGTTDRAPFYLKQMLSVAVQKESRAIVLCHNHPGGTLKPSKEDVVCTLQALKAMQATGVALLDHIIIAGKNAVSMRECGLISSKVWSSQNPSSPLLRYWLDLSLL